LKIWFFEEVPGFFDFLIDKPLVYEKLPGKIRGNVTPRCGQRQFLQDFGEVGGAGGRGRGEGGLGLT
jgi:hypothetical protein